MGQPVLDEEEEDGGEGDDDDGGSDEEEGNGDAPTEGRGNKGEGDEEEIVVEDSASLAHPVTKACFALMEKLRQLPIAGGAFGLSSLLCHAAVVRRGGRESNRLCSAPWATPSVLRWTWRPPLMCQCWVGS